MFLENDEGDTGAPYSLNNVKTWRRTMFGVENDNLSFIIIELQVIA